MLSFLAIGVLLGLAAGVSPGPLLTLVVSEALENGVPSGIKVALAPLLTDVPIIAMTLFVFSRLSGMDNVLGVISLAGGCYVLYMSYRHFRIDQQNRQSDGRPRSLTRGVLANALSPHPYLFWLSVGAPMVTKALGTGLVAALLFVGGFYAFLVGTKVVLAVLAGKSRSFLSGGAYRFTMRSLGVALAVFAVLLFTDGMKLLGVIQA